MPRLRKRDPRDRDALAPSPPSRHSSISRPVLRNSSLIPLSTITVPSTNMLSSMSEPSLKRKHRHSNSTLTATLVREHSSTPITAVKFRAEGRYRSRLQRILSTPSLNTTLNTTNSQTQGVSSGLGEGDTMKESGFTPTSAKESTPYPTTTEGATSSTIICGSSKPQHTPTATSRHDANDEDEDSEDSQPPRRRTRSTPRRMPPRKKAAVEASPIRGPSYSPLPLPARTNGGGGGGELSLGFPKNAAPSQITIDDLRRLKGVSSRVNNKPARMLGPMGSMLNSRDGSARTLAMPLTSTLGNDGKGGEDGSLNGTEKAYKAVEEASSAPAEAAISANEARQTRNAATPDLRDKIPIPGQKLPSPSPHAHPDPVPLLPQILSKPQPQVQSSPQAPLSIHIGDNDGPVTDQDRIAHLTGLCKQELDSNIRLRGERDAAQRRVSELEADKARLEDEVARLARYRAFVEQTKSNMDGL